MRKLRFSVNPDLVDKIPPKDKRSYSIGFTTIDDTLDRLLEVIRDGWAFSFCFADEIRKTANFLSADIIPIDIDGGMSFSEAKDDPIVKKYCSLIYTTASHTPEKQRFRLLFVLPRTITDAKEVKAASYALARRLGGDLASTDAARISFGASNCYAEILGNELSEEYLDDLIRDGTVEPVSDTVSDTQKATMSRSSQKLPRRFVVKTSKGVNVELKDIVTTTQIYCPFHKDQRPSAFVALNNRHSTYIHCSACRLTRWMEGMDDGGFNFNDFEDVVRRYHESPPRQGESGQTTLEAFLELGSYSKATNIHLSNKKYLHISKLPTGLVFIKSPKGSGKTDFMKRSLKNQKQIKASLNEFIDGGQPNAKVVSSNTKNILLIGHRQSLIRELCQRLDLECYLDNPKFYGFRSDGSIRLGVCLDSIKKIPSLGFGYDVLKFDVVVIDEVEQVLSHFLSETIGDKRVEIFDAFSTLISNAKSVVVLDADLGWISFNTISALATQDITNKQTPINIYINEWKTEPRQINIYPSRNQLIGHIKNSVLDGKRVFVTSNSKSKIKSLEAALVKLGIDKKIDIPIFTITSDNSKEAATQKFIQHIRSEIKKYQVILTSPSMGTGVDITFENNASDIDCVYGIFENLVNSHTEIDQQLARVRHPKEIHVWVSSATYNFETDFSVIKHEILENDFLARLFLKSAPDLGGGGNKAPSIFLSLLAMVVAYQRASKNNLKRNFIKYKTSQSWVVHNVTQDNEISELGREFFSEGQFIKDQEETQAVLNAKPMNEQQYEEFYDRYHSNEGVITRSELRSYYRTKIELFYREKISADLINLDDKGQFRRKVIMFLGVSDIEHLSNIYKDKIDRYESDDKRFELFLMSRNSAQLLLHDLFSLTPIYSKGAFFAEVDFDMSNLGKFIQMAIKRKPYVDTHLSINTSQDVASKPVQHLGKLLKAVGLELCRTGTRMENGKKIYRYRLNTELLDLVSKYASVRRAAAPKLDNYDEWESDWDFYNRLHDIQVIKEQ